MNFPHQLGFRKLSSDRHDHTRVVNLQNLSLLVKSERLIIGLFIDAILKYNRVRAVLKTRYLTLE